MVPRRSSYIRPGVPRELAVVDQAGCTGCEVCLEVCPVDCLYVIAGSDDPGRKKLVESDLDLCIGCRLCARYCPWDAITMAEAGRAPALAAEWTIRTVLPEKPWLAGTGVEPGVMLPTAFHPLRYSTVSGL